MCWGAVDESPYTQLEMIIGASPELFCKNTINIAWDQYLKAGFSNRNNSIVQTIP